MTELEVNTVLLADNANTVVVDMSSAQEVYVGDILVWNRTNGILPDKIIDLQASQDQVGQIQFGWNKGNYTSQTDLYEYPNILVQANVLECYTLYGADVGSKKYFVLSINVYGQTKSNVVIGTAL